MVIVTIIQRVKLIIDHTVIIITGHRWSTKIYISIGSPKLCWLVKLRALVLWKTPWPIWTYGTSVTWVNLAMLLVLSLSLWSLKVLETNF